MTELRPVYFDPMDVKIVEWGPNMTGPDFHPGEKWSNIAKLRWETGLLLARTGIRVRIGIGTSAIDGRVQVGVYSYSMTNISGGPMTYDAFVIFLRGVEAAACSLRTQDEKWPS